MSDVELNVVKGPRGSLALRDPSHPWLARWTDSVSGRQKYVYLPPTSPRTWDRLKAKFDAARTVGLALDGIVARNEAALRRARRAGDVRLLQLAACSQMLLELGLRVGSRRSAAAGVFGAATLLRRHVVPAHGSGLTLAFNGKDHVPYRRDRWTPRSTELEAYLREWGSPRSASRLFDSITPAAVNAHLRTLHPLLTAKVIRTARTNQEFQSALRGGEDEVAAETRAQLRAALDHAAQFCNHRKALGELARATTLANYVDPRLVVAFARRRGVPLEELVPRRLLTTRFAWAVAEEEA